MKKTGKNTFYLAIMLGAVLSGGLFILSGFYGSADISPDAVIRVIRYQVFRMDSVPISPAELSIIWKLRIPRALLAFFVGSGLALAGTAMQATMQNIMSEPYMLGVSSGSLSVITFCHFMNFPFIRSQFGRALAAFSGAVIALTVVYHVGGAGKKIKSTRLILTGMAVSTLLTAISNFFILMVPENNILKGILSWTMGSLAGARWNNVFLPIGVIILFSFFFFINGRNFDMISLGDETALSLGVNVVRLKKKAILTVSFIAGITVASCGLIGFVGFIVPHVLRRIFTSEHTKLFPLSFIYGGLFLLTMDILARVIAKPQELPIGIVTALAGAPVFIWVLLKKRM